MKRINLNLPSDIYENIEKTSNYYEDNITSTIKKLLKLGLFVVKIKEQENTELIIRKEGKDTFLDIIM